MKATFGAGCFWGVEEAFRDIPGVKSTAVGFMGGTVDHPSYEQVCEEETGHVEVVHLDFDPSVISYSKLLSVFWDCHDPTTLNRQGPDFGSQYRSVIFFHDLEQKRTALKQKEELQNTGKYQNPIVTQIEPASEFFPAEEYHQHYLQKRGITQFYDSNEQ